MDYLNRLIKALEDNDLYPDTRIIEDVAYPELVIGNRTFLCLCSNNYLGLSVHPEVKKAAIEGIKRYGIGTCDSRLIAGNLRLLEDLEQAISEFKHAEATMVFATGFLANIGVIPGVMDSADVYGLPSTDNTNNLIITDFLSHQSILAACKLSRSPTKTYLHKNMNHLETILKSNRGKRKLIVTDGLFSMDGDLAPLPDILELAGRYHAMVMVDDAHATGVIGENGRGTPEYFGVEGQVDMVIGTLSKAFGAIGGFLNGTPELIKLLKARSSSYVYSSSIPPEQACGILAALKIIQGQPELRKTFWNNVRHLKQGLTDMGFDIMSSETHIIPIFIGDERTCIQASRMLLEKGIIAPGVRSPIVQKGKARIRISPMATHTEGQIDMALEIFHEVGQKLGVI